jgi:hypothetical protein
VVHPAPVPAVPCTTPHPGLKQIQLVITCKAWHVGCPTSGMITINKRILTEVTFQLEQGNAAWGMLLLNEYLQQDCWLRRALTTRFNSRVGKGSLPLELSQKLVAGARAAELCKEEREAIGARTIPPRPTMFSVAPRRSVAERRIARRRFAVRG